MKQRIVSAAVGIVLLTGVLCLYKTIVLNIALAVVSTLAVQELLVATKCVKNGLAIIVGMVFAFLVPFFKEQDLIYICMAFALILSKSVSALAAFILAYVTTKNLESEVCVYE